MTNPLHAVILSVAKDLVAHRVRPFAALRVTSGGTRQTLAVVGRDRLRVA